MLRASLLRDVLGKGPGVGRHLEAREGAAMGREQDLVSIARDDAARGIATRAHCPLARPIADVMLQRSAHL